MKVINLNKSEDLLGKKLMRGCQIARPFYSQVIGCKVGNIRTALTYLARENVDKELVGKPKLTKAELNQIVEFPKRKIADYDNVLKALLSERIRNDKEIVIELSKLYNSDKKYFAVTFIAEDENSRKFEDMNRYCKILNRLMGDPVLVNIVLELSKEKPFYNRTIDTRNLTGKSKDKFKKNTFDKSRPFISNKVEKPSVAVVAKKEKVVKNFKKDLPFKNKTLEGSKK